MSDNDQNISVKSDEDVSVTVFLSPLLNASAKESSTSLYVSTITLRETDKSCTLENASQQEAGEANSASNSETVGSAFVATAGQTATKNPESAESMPEVGIGQPLAWTSSVVLNDSAKTITTLSSSWNEDSIDRTGTRSTVEQTSDYSTMESTALSDESSSMVRMLEGSVDRPPARETPGDTIVPVDPGTKEKVDDFKNADSAQTLANQSASSCGEANDCGKETDTFDDAYAKNIDLVQRYLEKAIGRKQNLSCFERSKRTIGSLIRCRSPTEHNRNCPSFSGARSSSPQRAVAPESSDGRAKNSPTFKLRLRTAIDRRNKQAQISQRHRPGNVSP